MTRRPWVRPELTPLPAVVDALRRGRLEKAPRSTLEPLVIALAVSWWPPSMSADTNPFPPVKRSAGLVLDWLTSQPGETWQERWLNSAADVSGYAWLDMAGIDGPARRADASYVMSALLVLRAIKPSLNWLMDTRRIRLWNDYACYHDSELFQELKQILVRTTDARNATHVTADLVRMCLSTGKGLRQLNRDDFLHARETTRLSGRKFHTTQSSWHYARQLGLMPQEPMVLPVSNGPLSPTALVDRYGVDDPEIRGVFVDYLTERATDCDYSTLQHLTLHLVKHFWCDLQVAHPGLKTLALSQDQSKAWRARVAVLPNGQPRRHWLDVLGSVRAFYLDISAWAQDDPGRWARWVAPCPVPPRTSRQAYRNRHSQKADMQARTRRLLPVLPQLATAVGDHLGFVERSLAAALTVEPGEAFSVDGQRWRRHQHKSTYDSVRSTVIATGPNGDRVSLTRMEDQAFWTWAAVEVLRHSGIRIEEMLELTHLSIRPFRKPSGEVIPLLQIAPSKTDRERVLPASPALARALGRILVRHAAVTGDKKVPLVARLDEHERTYSAPMPFLFQRRWVSGRDQAMSSTAFRKYLAVAANQAKLHDVDGATLTFTPHDFRRLYLTDVTNSGLPIHIAAQLAGHENLNTTRGYVATYPTEVFDQYEKFLARRRQERPSDEYRRPTTEELKEFGEHFGKRRVELGNCARPYGTACVHEHACIRCDLLRVQPDAGDRLQRIEDDLEVRIGAAETNQWLGDVEQLRLTMSHLQEKKVQLGELMATLPGGTLTLDHVPVLTAADVVRQRT